MKKNKIIRFCIVIGIFLMIFGIVFLTNSLTKKNQNIYQEPEPEKIPYDMQTVTEYSYFFSVVNILNKYLGYLADQNTEALYQVLHPDYQSLNKINDSNLYNNVGNFKDKILSFKAKIMAYKTYNNCYLYYVKGDIINNNFEDSNILKNNAMFLVNIDYDNLSYAIYPLNDISEDLPIKEPELEITLNNYNELQGSNIITEDYICNLYLNDFIEKINNNPSDTYSLLNNDFRKKQYPTIEDYLNFISNHKDKFNSQVYSCSSLSGTSHVYEVKDMNFNSYTFTEESIMNYKVEFTIN